MCELTFVCTPDRLLNRLILLSALQQNPLSGHKDGTGFFIPNSRILKTNVPGHMILDLGERIKELIKTSDPIIGHVRQASLNAGKRLLTPDKAHPFETERLVIAHNGTLEYKDWKRKFPLDMIDSEVFLGDLEKNYDGKNLTAALKKTMEIYRGKFAFLLYSKTERRYYVARGETAKLYRSDIKLNDSPYGFVLNTEGSDLSVLLNRAKNFVEISTNNFMEFSAPVEIDKESIFVLDDNRNLVKIDTIKENRGYVTYSCDDGYTYTRNTSGNTGVVNPPLTTEEKFINTIYKFSEMSGMNLREIDKLLFYSLGFGIIEITQTDMETFVNYVLPELEKRIKSNDKLKIYWENIKNTYKNPYVDLSIQFPYMLEDPRAIKSVSKEIGRDKYRRRLIDG